MDPYAIDGHKLMYHPRRVAQWLEAGDDWERARRVYPVYVEVSPVGACNHRCLFCAVDYIGYRARRLPTALMAERLQEMGRLGVRSVMFAGEGEPLLHKGIVELVRACAQEGVDVAFTTNATVLPEGFAEEALPHVAWLKASVNAGTPETYARIHRAPERDFHRALGHLRTLVEARAGGGCTVGVQALLLPENAHEMERLAALCRDELGVDYLVVKPYSQHPFSRTRRYAGLDYAEYLALEERLLGYVTEGFRVIFRRRTMRKYGEARRGYVRCHATPFFWAYVMADGSVWGCSAYLLDERFRYGNLLERSFREIWEGEARRRSFEHVRRELDVSGCRRNCRMDEVNRYLADLAEERVPHVNFI